MSDRDDIRRLLGMVRLRLWSRGLARCNHCARMTRQEWETMCDCWLADVAWWRRFGLATHAQRLLLDNLNREEHQ